MRLFLTGGILVHGRAQALRGIKPWACSRSGQGVWLLPLCLCPGLSGWRCESCCLLKFRLWQVRLTGRRRQELCISTLQTASLYVCLHCLQLPATFFYKRRPEGEKQACSLLKVPASIKFWVIFLSDMYTWPWRTLLRESHLATGPYQRW